MSQLRAFMIQFQCKLADCGGLYKTGTGINACLSCSAQTKTNKNIKSDVSINSGTLRKLEKLSSNQQKSLILKRVFCWKKIVRAPFLKLRYWKRNYFIVLNFSTGRFLCLRPFSKFNDRNSQILYSLIRMHLTIQKHFNQNKNRNI